MRSSLSLLLLAAIAAPAAARDVRRIVPEGAAIAASVEVPAGSRLVYVSGSVPDVADIEP